LEKEDVVENDAEVVVHVVDFEEKEGYFEEETLKKEYMVENDVEEVVHMVDFEEEG
jgi:hypothetical protein